jgi:hypothetical protein
VKAVTGAADHERHDEQWQYPIASGSPSAAISTLPQKHLPLCVVIVLILLAGHVDVRSYARFTHAIE